MRALALVVAAFGDGGTKVFSALMHPANGLRKDLAGNLFDQIAGRPEPHDGLDIGVIMVGRKDEDPSVGAIPQDLTRGLDAVELRHGDVHEDNIGLELRCEGHGISAVFSLGDDPDVCLPLKQCAQALPYDGMILDDEHGNGNYGGRVQFTRARAGRIRRGRLICFGCRRGLDFVGIAVAIRIHVLRVGFGDETFEVAAETVCIRVGVCGRGEEQGDFSVVQPVPIDIGENVAGVVGGDLAPSEPIAVGVRIL
jgi:hypothetical protein